MRFKLFFKKLVDDGDIYDIYIPSNRKEVDKTIELIKSKLK
jgi:cytidylate kinase